MKFNKKVVIWLVFTILLISFVLANPGFSTWLANNYNEGAWTQSNLNLPLRPLNLSNHTAPSTCILGNNQTFGKNTLQFQYADVDNDGVAEIVAFCNDNYLRIYNFSGEIEGLTLEGELNVGLVMGNYEVENMDSDNEVEIIAVVSDTGSPPKTNFTIYSWNTTDFVIEFSTNVSNESGDQFMRCLTWNSEKNCLYNSNDQKIHIRNSTGDAVFELLFEGKTPFNFHSPPIISDWDLDNTLEACFHNFRNITCIDENNVNEFNKTFSLLDGSGRNGIVDFEFYQKEYSSHIGFLGWLFGSDTKGELAVTYVIDDTYDECVLDIYNPSGSLKFTQTHQAETSGDVIYNCEFFHYRAKNVDNEAVESMTCWTAKSGGGGNPREFIECFDEDEDQQFYHAEAGLLAEIVWGTGSEDSNLPRLFLNDLDSDGHLDLITSKALINLDKYYNQNDTGNRIFNNINLQEEFTIGDYDGDTFTDFIDNSGGTFTYMRTNISNDLPILISLSADTGNPVCIDQRITWSVDEYNDTEGSNIKFAVFCEGKNNTWTGWSSYSSSPTKTCDYNTTGSFNPIFFITDLAHPNHLESNLSYSSLCGNMLRVDYGGSCNLVGQNPKVCNKVLIDTVYTDARINKTWELSDFEGEYSSRYFDWSGCEGWTILYFTCPFINLANSILAGIINWIFVGFISFLVVLIIIVIIKMGYKRGE